MRSPSKTPPALTVPRALRSNEFWQSLLRMTRLSHYEHGRSWTKQFALLI